jgi:hypothetical protein
MTPADLGIKWHQQDTDDARAGLDDRRQVTGSQVLTTRTTSPVSVALIKFALLISRATAYLSSRPVSSSRFLRIAAVAADAAYHATGRIRARTSEPNERASRSIWARLVIET